MPKLAEYFYNDTYLFDQNACTSPHLIVWLGENEIVVAAKKLFWDTVAEVVREKYAHQTVIALDKLTTFYRQSVTCDLKKEPVEDNRLWRTELKMIPKKNKKKKVYDGKNISVNIFDVTIKKRKFQREIIEQGSASGVLAFEGTKVIFS